MKLLVNCATQFVLLSFLARCKTQDVLLFDSRGENHFEHEALNLQPGRLDFVRECFAKHPTQRPQQALTHDAIL